MNADEVTSSVLEFTQNRIREFCEVDGGLCVLILPSQAHVRVWVEDRGPTHNDRPEDVSAEVIDAMAYALLDDPTVGPSFLRATRKDCVVRVCRWLSTKLGFNGLDGKDES